jgi:hypothetical protein
MKGPLKLKDAKAKATVSRCFFTIENGQVKPVGLDLKDLRRAAAISEVISAGMDGKTGEFSGNEVEISDVEEIILIKRLFEQKLAKKEWTFDLAKQVSEMADLLGC